MTATLTHSVIPVVAVDLADLVDLPEPAARILLKPPSEHPGMVNGAWWPRSRDLVRELPPLVAALDGIQTASSLIATASAPSAPLAGTFRDAERITAWESEGGPTLVRA